MPVSTHPALQVFNRSGVRVPVSRKEISALLSTFERVRQCSIAFLEVVLLDDDGIVEVNREHLQKDYVTDIITFPYHEFEGAPLEGTLFIGLTRVREQAAEFNQAFTREFSRVVIHGLLHLHGMNDETDREEADMHAEEDRILEALHHGS